MVDRLIILHCSFCSLHGLTSATSQEFFMNPCRASRDATTCWHDTVEIQMMKKEPSDGGIFLFYPSTSCGQCTIECFAFPGCPLYHRRHTVYQIETLHQDCCRRGQTCLGVHPGDLFRQSIDDAFHFLWDFIILWVFIFDNDTLGSTYACALQVAPRA